MFGTMNVGTPQSDGFIWLINDNGTNVSQEITFGSNVFDWVQAAAGNICFLAGTLVETDQGNIHIEEITTEHSINGYPVSKLVAVHNSLDYMVMIKQNSLDDNVPNRDTIISPLHGILINKKLVQAHTLINNKTILKHPGEDLSPNYLVYNIVLDGFYLMTIHNMSVETLDPRNKFSNNQQAVMQGDASHLTTSNEFYHYLKNV